MPGPQGFRDKPPPPAMECDSGTALPGGAVMHAYGDAVTVEAGHDRRGAATVSVRLAKLLQQPGICVLAPRSPLHDGGKVGVDGHRSLCRRSLAGCDSEQAALAAPHGQLRDLLN